MSEHERDFGPILVAESSHGFGLSSTVNAVLVWPRDRMGVSRILERVLCTR